MIYSSMLTMCILMKPLSKKDLTLIFWLEQPWDLLLLIWNQKAPAPSPQRVISILWILIISLNLLMHIPQSVNSFILSMMISSKARIPNGFKKLTADFELSNAQEVFSIPYLVASETYVWSFQYRVLNFILFTNDKLFKMGLSDSDKCSFCGTYTEDLYHLFFNCSFVQAVWNVLTVWWFDLSGKYLTLSLKDIMVGLLQRNNLLNYLIILGKLTIWECRKNNTSLIFRLFLHKVEVKKQVKK